MPSRVPAGALHLASGMSRYRGASWEGRYSGRETDCVLGGVDAEDQPARAASAPAPETRPRAVRGQGNELADPRLPARLRRRSTAMACDGVPRPVPVPGGDPARLAAAHGRALEHAR